MKTITWDDLDEIEDKWEAMTDAEAYAQTRWTVCYQQVFKSPEDKHFLIQWQRGATEYQDPPDTIYMTEVEPYETMVIKYRAKK
jgi:hypothetical protein